MRDIASRCYAKTSQASQWTMGFRLGGGEGDQVEGEWGRDKPKHLTRVGTNIVDTASGFI